MKAKILLAAILGFSSFCAYSQSPEVEGVEVEEYEAYDYYSNFGDGTAAKAFFDSIGSEYPMTNLEDLLWEGEFDQAMDAINQVLAAVPDDAFAIGMRGYVKIFMGKGLKEFIPDIIYAWEHDVFNPLEMYQRQPLEIIYYSIAAEPETTINGLRELEKRLSHDDSWHRFEAMLMMADAYSNLGQCSAAMDLCDKMLQLTDEPEIQNAALTHKIAFLSRMDKNEEAIALLNDPRIEQNASYDRYYYSAQAYRQLGNLDEAIKWCGLGLQEYPYNEGLEDLKAICLMFKDYDMAIEYISDEIDDDFRHEYMRDDHYMVLRLRRGIAYMLKGDAERANRDFEYIISLSDGSGLYPQDSSFNIYALAYSGRRDEAKQILQEANINDNTLLSGVYAALGEDDLAIDYLGKAFETKATNPQRVKTDVNLFRLTSDARYDEVVRRHFDPNK